MRRKSTTKLHLHRETLRRLSDHELVEAHGGKPSLTAATCFCTELCPSSPELCGPVTAETC